MYKVFIVDDEPFIIDGLYDIIDWSALELEIVGHAENGRQALEALAEKPADVLVTDISMPVMNGLELIAQAREFRPDLKVIILSGYNEFDYLKEGMKLGIENYLLKPINVEELEATLLNTVDKLNRDKSEEAHDAFDIRILKDNTLYRWLTGQIAQKEMEERIGLLGLTLDGSHMAVGVMRTPHHLPAVFERTDAWLREEGAAVFRDVTGDIVIIGNLRSSIEGAEFALKMERLADDLAKSGYPVRIGVGSVEPLLMDRSGYGDEGSLSYQEAKRALEYSLIYPNRLVIEYRAAEGEWRSESGLYDLQWEDYARLILARDPQQVKERIRTDFQAMRNLDGIKPEHLQNAAMELVVRFKIELKQIKHTDEPDMYNEALRRIQTSTSFDELLLILEEAAEQTVGSLLADVTNPIVNQVLDHIHRHYADELSLKKLGALYHTHPVYLGQLFHKQTGSTFAEYMNKYRIEQAKQQLKSSTLKVHEIARNVGYWELGYFYKQFRKYVGISPTEYKALQ